MNGVPNLPRTGQQSDLANFVEANQADLVNYVVQAACPALVSAAGAAAGVPVPPQVSGVLCNLIGQFINLVLDKCADPFEKNRQFREMLGTTLGTVAAHIPPLAPPPVPAPEDLPLIRWSQVDAEWQAGTGRVGEELDTTWSQRFDSFLAVAPMVLPGPTLVTLRWLVSAGAGGLCEQDMAAVKLLGQGGRVIFEREVEGVFKVGQSESRDDGGSVTIELPPGNYLLVGAVSGPSGHATLAADYMVTRVELTVEEPASPLGLVLIGAGAWMLATGGRD